MYILLQERATEIVDETIKGKGGFSKVKRYMWSGDGSTIRDSSDINKKIHIVRLGKTTLESVVIQI